MNRKVTAQLMPSRSAGLEMRCNRSVAREWLGAGTGSPSLGGLEGPSGLILRAMLDCVCLCRGARAVALICCVVAALIITCITARYEC